MDELGNLWPYLPYVWQAGIIGLYVLTAAFFVGVLWPEIKRWWNPPLLEVRTVHGSSIFSMIDGRSCTAKLAVRNVSGKPLTDCSAKLEDAAPILDTGEIWEGISKKPSVSSARGEGFFLRWASNEPHKESGRLLDIPDGSSEHFVDLVSIDGGLAYARFCAVNVNDLPATDGIDNRWWKLVVLLRSNLGSQRFQFIAACSDRDPGPIPVHRWEDKGDAIISALKLEHESSKQSRPKPPNCDPSHLGREKRKKRQAKGNRREQP